MALVAENLTEKPEIISVTDLSSYLFCPRSLYMNRVLGYPVKFNEAMLLGSIRHNFADLANTYEENIVVHMPSGLSKEEVVSAYSKTYHNLLRISALKYAKALAGFDLDANSVIGKLEPIAAVEARDRAENVHKFATEKQVVGEELWKQLSPKIHSEFKVNSPTLRLKGVIDRVEIYDNAVLPIELKTGKMAREGVWPSHRIQVAAYMMLLGERFQKAVGRAVIKYLDHQTSRTVSLNPYMELEVKETTEKVIRMLASQQIPRPCGREKCACAN